MDDQHPTMQLPPAGMSGAAPVNGSAAPAVPQVAAPPAHPARHWTFWVPTSILTVMLLAAVAIGMFFVGQGTRPSETDVNQRLATAVAKQRHSDTVNKAAALRRQKASLATMFHRREARTAKAAFGRGRSKGRDEGYKNGQNVGYASGKSAGRVEGVQEGQAQGYQQGNLDGFFEGLGAAYDY